MHPVLKYHPMRQEMSPRTSDFSAFWKSMAMRLFWEYTSTDCTVTIHVAQHCDLFGVLFGACLPATVLHDLLTEGRVSSTVPFEYKTVTVQYYRNGDN